MASVILLNSYTVASDNTISAITFSSIPQTYTDLYIIPTFSGQGSYIRFNGDTGSNYTNRFVINFDTYPVRSYQNSSNITDALFCIEVGDSSGYPLFRGNGTLYINDYSNSSVTKTTSSIVGLNQNVSTDYYYANCMATGFWNNTSAINSITFGYGASYFKAGSTVQLYGIKNS